MPCIRPTSRVRQRKPWSCTCAARACGAVSPAWLWAWKCTVPSPWPCRWKCTRSRHSRHSTWVPRPTSMTPTAVSIGRATPSGIAWPSRIAAPAKTNSVSVWPSPQVSPCLTISATWLRRAAMLETAAMWSASSACCMPIKNPSPRIPNIRPLPLYQSIRYPPKPLSGQDFIEQAFHRRPGEAVPLFFVERGAHCRAGGGRVGETVQRFAIGDDLPVLHAARPHFVLEIGDLFRRRQRIVDPGADQHAGPHSPRLRRHFGRQHAVETDHRLQGGPLARGFQAHRPAKTEADR